MAQILVADDAAMLRRVVCRSLQPHQTLEAADGDEALEMLREHRPRVAILDWMMPGLSGLEVCLAARADPSTAGTIFVMMTARQGHDVEDQALAAGANHFLRKPVMPQQLLELVTPLLNGPMSTGASSPGPAEPPASRYKVKSDVARNRLMLRAAGRLTEEVLDAITAEVGGELDHLEPGHAVWVDLRSTELAGHAPEVHLKQLYTLIVSMSPSKVGTLVGDVTMQMHVARTSGQADAPDRARVFTEEQQWLRFLR